MRSSRHIFILAAAFSACIGCGSSAPKLSDADVAAIRNATRQYVEWDEARNPAVLQFIAQDAVYMPPGAAPLHGRKAIEELFKAHPWEHLSESLAEVDGRGDLAFARGTWSITFNGKPAAGSYIEEWQKQPDGAWQIIRKVWNTE
jgi:ketosteroid isomerase-like protein